MTSINVVMASWDLATVKTIESSDILMMAPADEEEGFVIFKTTEPGYFIVADK
ncbi:MAG: hypothetical protein ABGX71_08390 [Methyloprofundus sp.]|uniref:hypothetical protein n=1 Tax=Methyloprofundus sp. TaxID=2020875 RepID=UPI002618F6A5|nr:hypothetical protein [Methyloprofundus sp.]